MRTALLHTSHHLAVSWSLKFTYFLFRTAGGDGQPTACLGMDLERVRGESLNTYPTPTTRPPTAVAVPDNVQS